MRFFNTISLCLALLGSVVGQPTIAGLTAVGTSTLTPSILGGITFDAVGGTLYVSNAGAGLIEAYPVVRDPSTYQVTGFGTPTVVTSALGAEGVDNLGGTWLWTTWPGNELGQYVPATGATALTNLGSVGVPASTGGLRVVPPWMPNAGTVLVSSYSQGGIYEVTLTPDPSGNGTFQPVAASLFASTPAGAEGMAFVPTGPYTGSIVHANYGSGEVTLLMTDPATGLPTGQSELLITGIGSAMGVAFDPVTNDLFVSSYTSSNNLHHFSGAIIGDYQRNQAAAALDVNGEVGGLMAPALTNIAPGQSVTVNWTSTNVGQPFDIAVAGSLVPAGQTTLGGQVVNIDLGSSFSWVLGGSFSQVFAPSSASVAPTGAVAAQMVVFDPASIDGFALSQPNLVQ